jgi:hypothetical protein
MDHKIYDYPHKKATHVMFSEKVVTIKVKNEHVVMNMVLAMTTRNQISKIVVLTEKELQKNKNFIEWYEWEKLQ